MICSLYDRDLASKPTDSLRHLDADGPTAEDEQMSRDGCHAGGFAIRPDAVELLKARDRWNDRVGPGCEDYVLRCELFVVDVHEAFAREPSVSTHQLDAV